MAKARTTVHGCGPFLRSAVTHQDCVSALLEHTSCHTIDSGWMASARQPTVCTA